MWQPSDQVDIDVRNPGRSQSRNVIKNLLPIVQTPDRGRLLIDKRLHSQAHAVHAAALKSLNHRLS